MFTLTWDITWYKIKKCDSCWYCSINPPRLHENIFQSLNFVPYPEVENGSYKSFDDTYGKETSEQYRPSLASKPQKTERDKKFKSFFTAAKVRGYLICSECGKRRVVYSSATLLQRERIQLQRTQEELHYTCGAAAFPGSHDLFDKLVVKEGMSCSTPIETTYYTGSGASRFEDICYYCGDNEILEDNDEIDELKAQYGIVRPICESCFAKGLRPNVRNKIMVGQGKKSRKN